MSLVPMTGGRGRTGGALGMTTTTTATTTMTLTPRTLLHIVSTHLIPLVDNSIGLPSLVSAPPFIIFRVNWLAAIFWEGSPPTKRNELPLFLSFLSRLSLSLSLFFDATQNNSTQRKCLQCSRLKKYHVLYTYLPTSISSSPPKNNPPAPRPVPPRPRPRPNSESSDLDLAAVIAA